MYGLSTPGLFKYSNPRPYGRQYRRDLGAPTDKVTERWSECDKGEKYWTTVCYSPLSIEFIDSACRNAAPHTGLPRQNMAMPKGLSVTSSMDSPLPSYAIKSGDPLTKVSGECSRCGPGCLMIPGSDAAVE